MREILFRGKQKSCGVWLFGDLRQWSEKRKGICDYKLGRTLDVYPATVGQFTGLTDKNGKKIFEGDCINHRMNVVEFCSGEFCVGGDRPLWLMAKYGEVIGNIHDHPELLEGGVENAAD